MTAGGITGNRFTLNLDSLFLITAPTMALRSKESFCSINTECSLSRVLRPKV